MHGWTILFALIATFAAITAAAALPTPALASVVTSLVFAVLFLISLLVRAIRGRA